MRIVFISLLLFLYFNASASAVTKRAVSDSIQIKLNEVKSILNSREWEPVDRDQYKRINELISFIENTPIDSVVMELKHDLDSTQIFLKRELRNISEANNIEGYIRAWEINNSMINIEKKTVEEMPFESIMVPEDEFVGMYSKIPLITYGNMSKLISDSIITYPDSLLSLIANSKMFFSSRKAKETDSIVTHFLDNARKEYNNRLINAYRDSVIYNYRVQHLKEFTDLRKKQYIDSVSKHNLQVLKNYNDSVSKQFNLKFADMLKSLVTSANRFPHKLTIYNYFNEPTTLMLQNDALWYQWVWLKNAQNDSIGLRVENIDKHQFRVLIDEMVNLSRITQRESMTVDKVQQNTKLEQKLLKVTTRKPELSPWKLAGKIYSGFTQTYINDYWSKGGNSSASALSTFGYDANYSKGKLKWENRLDAKLGLIYYLPDEGTTALRNWHKNSDNFEINSRLGYSAYKEWYYSAEVNFKTQFFLGFKSNKDEAPNSSLFSPAYLTFSGGFDYKPNKQFLMPLIYLYY